MKAKEKNRVTIQERMIVENKEIYIFLKKITVMTLMMEK